MSNSDPDTSTDTSTETNGQLTKQDLTPKQMRRQLVKDIHARARKDKAFTSLVQMLAPGTRIRASAVEINRAAFQNACYIMGKDPLDIFRELMQMTEAERPGRRIEPVWQIIEEPSVTVNTITDGSENGKDGEDREGGEEIGLPSLDGFDEDGHVTKTLRVVRGGIEVPAMVPDHRTRAQAIAMTLRLTGLDPGLSLKVDGLGGTGDSQPGTVNVAVTQIRVEINKAVEAGDFERLQELYRQRKLMPKATDSEQTSGESDNSNNNNGAEAITDAEFEVTTVGEP